MTPEPDDLVQITSLITMLRGRSMLGGRVRVRSVDARGVRGAVVAVPHEAQQNAIGTDVVLYSPEFEIVLPMTLRVEDEA